MLSSMTSRLNALCARHSLLTVIFFILLCLGAGWFSTTHLGITTETDKLFSDSLPWKQRNQNLERLFPGDKNTLVAIIKADTPEEGRETAHALADRLSHDHTHFATVTEPDNNPFYTHNAFLFLDSNQLEPLLDSTISAQPFLGTLAADPSARGLFDTFSLIARGIQNNQAIPESFNTALNGLSASLEKAAEGHAEPLSWQRLLAGKLSDMGSQYQFVVTTPRPDFSSFEPSEASTTAMRHALNTLPDIQSGRAQAVITGDAKLSDEEFSTVADGMVWGLFLSLGLVTLWLLLAARSLRLILPILITLIAGLLLTTGFAALAVGTLNLISVAFAILFVGIAVDFAIQYGVRFRCQKDENNTPLPADQALLRTGKESGVQIFIAALATSAGFLAFTPTNFVGVAQLGLIAGVGMMIAFLCTLSLLPALIALFKAQPTHNSRGFSFLKPADIFLRTYRRPVLLLFSLLGLSGLGMSSLLTFDSDPLHTKNPHTEGMQALHLLEENPLTTPYNAQVLLTSYESAQRQAKQFNALNSVHDVLWIGALVPDNQDTKIQLIHDAADILLPTLTTNNIISVPTAKELRASTLKAAHSFDAIDPHKMSPALQTLHHALIKLADAPDTSLLTANTALTRFLPAELEQLRTVLSPNPITLQNIPQDIRQDYVTPDGKYYRLVIHPNGQMSQSSTLHKFVHDIQSVNSNIAGPALEITESAQTITHAFLFAAIGAIIAISGILFCALRRLIDSLLVLLPLLLSSLLTVILIVSVPETLNYANIIALPLLLGVGVSFNIYFVMNWRDGTYYPLTSPTARAVLFSALTTGSAFGSLALSAHPGTASMGRLLLLSLGCTLLCSFIFIPSLLPKKNN